MVEYVVTAGRLNFRSRPDSGDAGNIIATLSRGHLLEGEETPPGGGWLRVSTLVPSMQQEKDGFVSALYAVETADSPAAVPAPVAAAGAPPAAAPVITLAELKVLTPNGKDAFMAPLAQRCVDVRVQYGLATTPLHLCHFLAQLAHESAGFRTMREYWGPTNAQRAYEGRTDLGNLQPGDGKRFMGRGFIQITGRANYRKYGELLGLPLTANPALAEDPMTALNLACLYWKARDIDTPAGADDIRAVTKKINGGTNGLAERTALFRKARRLWP